MTMTTCQHPAAQIHSNALLMTCPDCGAECSGDQVGDDALCYDQACPLHVMAGEILTEAESLPDSHEVATTTYKISNAEGRQGRAWTAEYATREEAAQAIRQAMGWDAVVLSGSYAVDAGSAVSAYETQEECDADQTGAWAPRIVEAREIQATDAQIAALGAEAAEHGDDAMAATCNRALIGDREAIRIVERALKDAAAQVDG
jgi:hypothetical protein